MKHRALGSSAPAQSRVCGIPIPRGCQRWPSHPHLTALHEVMCNKTGARALLRSIAMDEFLAQRRPPSMTPPTSEAGVRRVCGDTYIQRRSLTIEGKRGRWGVYVFTHGFHKDVVGRMPLNGPRAKPRRR